MNYNFGPYSAGNIKMSIYGMAVKNKIGKYVSYDTKTKSLMDVDIFNFDIDPSKIFYKIPKAINNVEPGDIIIHNDKPVFVENVREDGKFDVINPYEGEAVTILPLKNQFGFNYCISIVSLLNELTAPTENNPFGDYWPLMLSGDNNNLLPLLLMNNNDVDPMMLMALMGKGDITGFFILQAMNKNKKNVSKNRFHSTFGPGIEDRFE